MKSRNLTALSLAFIKLASILQKSSAKTTTFTGPASIYCTDATCRIPVNCDESLADGLSEDVIKDTDDPEIYSKINGSFTLQEPCVVECEGCGGIFTGEDDDVDESCIEIAGFTYCRETNECIRPFEQSCPLEGTLRSLTGPGTLHCEDGARCIDLDDECEISLGLFSIGGKFMPGLQGDYGLAEGCQITCDECICEDCAEQEETEGSSSTVVNSSSPSKATILSLVGATVSATTWIF